MTVKKKTNHPTNRSLPHTSGQEDQAAMLDFKLIAVWTFEFKALI